jgi:hypothetical protein
MIGVAQLGAVVVEDSSKPALLFRREMNRHVLLLRGLVIFRVGEK